MADVLRGGCACGRVRYEVAATPAFSLLCKCRQCQRITGSGHAAQFAAHAENAKILGELKYFDYMADSGNSVRCGFCPSCGNPILKEPTRFPQFVFIHAGTLDEPEAYRPEMVVFSASGQTWDHVDPSLPLR